jgi:hypothetical protein
MKNEFACGVGWFVMVFIVGLFAKKTQWASRSVVVDPSPFSHDTAVVLNLFSLISTDTKTSFSSPVERYPFRQSTATRLSDNRQESPACLSSGNVS